MLRFYFKPLNFPNSPNFDFHLDKQAEEEISIKALFILSYLYISDSSGSENAEELGVGEERETHASLCVSIIRKPC